MPTALHMRTDKAPTVIPLGPVGLDLAEHGIFVYHYHTLTLTSRLYNGSPLTPAPPSTAMGRAALLEEVSSKWGNSWMPTCGCAVSIAVVDRMLKALLWMGVLYQDDGGVIFYSLFG